MGNKLLGRSRGNSTTPITIGNLGEDTQSRSRAQRLADKRPASTLAWNVKSASSSSLLKRTGSGSSTASATSTLSVHNDGYFSFDERRKYEGSCVYSKPKYTDPIHWRKGELLGSGAFGKVYLGLHTRTGELMAAKQIALVEHGEAADQCLRSLENEIKVLRKLEHKNIVRYWGTERTDAQFTIFMEYIPGGSICSLLKKFGPFNETLVRVYAKQILEGLHYLHSHRIMHRDIKGGNILVDRGGVCKLSDFGAARHLSDLTNASNGPQSLKGTPYWMAPEVVRQTGHGRQADIWSVGCTIIEMSTGKPPWSQFEQPVSALFHIAVSNDPPPFPEHLSDTAHDFLSLCFKKDPSERPTAIALLEHPFITSSFVTAPSLRSLDLTDADLEVKTPSNGSHGNTLGSHNNGHGVASPVHNNAELSMGRTLSIISVNSHQQQSPTSRSTNSPRAVDVSTAAAAGTVAAAAAAGGGGGGGGGPRRPLLPAAGAAAGGGGSMLLNRQMSEQTVASSIAGANSPRSLALPTASPKAGAGSARQAQAKPGMLATNKVRLVFNAGAAPATGGNSSTSPEAAAAGAGAGTSNGSSPASATGQQQQQHQQHSGHNSVGSTGQASSDSAIFSTGSSAGSTGGGAGGGAGAAAAAAGGVPTAGGEDGSGFIWRRISAVQQAGGDSPIVSPRSQPPQHPQAQQQQYASQQQQQQQQQYVQQQQQRLQQHQSDHSSYSSNTSGASRHRSSLRQHFSGADWSRHVGEQNSATYESFRAYVEGGNPYASPSNAQQVRHRSVLAHHYSDGTRHHPDDDMQSITSARSAPVVRRVNKSFTEASNLHQQPGVANTPDSVRRMQRRATTRSPRGPIGGAGGLDSVAEPSSGLVYSTPGLPLAAAPAGSRRSGRAASEPTNNPFAANAQSPFAPVGSVGSARAQPVVQLHMHGQTPPPSNRASLQLDWGDMEDEPADGGGGGAMGLPGNSFSSARSEVDTAADAYAQGFAHGQAAAAAAAVAATNSYYAQQAQQASRSPGRSLVSGASFSELYNQHQQQKQQVQQFSEGVELPGSTTPTHA